MCRFCDKNRAPALSSGKVNLEVYLNGDTLMIETKDEIEKYDSIIEINYCPVCGERLKEDLSSEKELLNIL